jgi:hypothetical protein
MCHEVAAAAIWPARCGATAGFAAFLADSCRARCGRAVRLADRPHRQTEWPPQNCTNRPNESRSHFSAWSRDPLNYNWWSNAHVDEMANAQRSVVRLDGPPPNLSTLTDFVEAQFGSNRRLVSRHRDRGLADQFRRLRARWQAGHRDAMWFSALDAGSKTSGVAIVTKAGATWSNRSFAGAHASSELAIAFTDRNRTMGLRDFTRQILRMLDPECYPVRVYGYALSHSVGYWAKCAPTMGAAAAHNVLGVPCWIWLDRSLIGVNLSEPSEVARAVRTFPGRYLSGPALDPRIMTSVGTVRAYDSPFAGVVHDSAGRPHPLSVDNSTAELHAERVRAAFEEIPAARRIRIRDHFSSLGLLGNGLGTTIRFWLKFAPTVLLEERFWLWPALDAYTRVKRLHAPPTR